MKKNGFTLALFLLLGLLAAAIVTQLLVSVPWLGFLTNSAHITWEPKADLNVIKYDLFIQVKLNVISLLGIVAAIWIYRRM
ncbi:DUF4321 domain-containing protein [Paenibacillus ginsengarvi]|uniref:DUF4321 domain-containing protein n=1 Tax=Paenibacillus ginsengarvi TaxID=400777 RepID=A0A3B0CG27_9BACL|nr:DUF4321 domain-containing protein [Paenibacillus ginsengarvi]RKN83858.1 DUF4321 domain-containing protein [Paenibacillus ginsengarvi]